jgi:alpha-beta hydrolase superfamily lysophospholipase
MSAEHLSGKCPKGVIIFLHGYGSYTGKFGYIAQIYAEHGYDFVGYDVTGFGHSEGVKGLIFSKESFLIDGH